MPTNRFSIKSIVREASSCNKNMEINEKRVHQQIRNFEKALAGYTYDEPLSRYLTRFFKDNKQMGSSDRRMTSRFCYTYFRLGNSLKQHTIIDRLVFAEYLCEQSSAVVFIFRPDLALSIQEPLSYKINVLTRDYGFVMAELFPLIDHISTEVDRDCFLESHFIQPDLFLRIRKGKESYVHSIFEKNDIPFTVLTTRTLALPNGTNLQKVANIEGMYEVQDLSSQQTIDYIQAKNHQKWWDACAASGGKALMFLDEYPQANILVSDIRMSILRNLDERFDRAGISSSYRKKILDLAQPVDHIMKREQFDGIILDAPCSGSGTWGRTPEMIQQFSLQKLETFTSLQKNIASNVVPYLKKGASLIYITCSIYKDENEDVVAYLLSHFDLELDKKGIIVGYNNKADSMFAAHFIKK